MDPMDFLENEKLLRVFHCHKTELSCMENPHTFLNQIRDHDLIPEDRYEKLSRMKSKENLKRGLYDVLDWLEKNQSEHILVFWKCVFKEPTLRNYPTLQRLHKSLLDGSDHFDSQLPERVEMEDDEERERKQLSEDEPKQAKSVKKKRKRRTRSADDTDDDEQPGPSSQVTPSQRKKTKKISFSSPLKKGEKGEIWTWPFYNSQLPVTCGAMKGMLQRDRLAKGEKCILVKQWFTPTEFEKFAGKESSKNWKLSIRCNDTTLGKLIEEGHLKAVTYKRRSITAKKSLCPSSCSATESETEEDENKEEDEGEEGNQEDHVPTNDKEIDTDEEEEMEDQTEQQPGTSQDSKKVLKVTCGHATGTLHVKRFASGILGKSIRTETSWLTPVDFAEESCQTAASWRKEIKVEGEPISALIQAKLLRVHSLLCHCILCKPDTEALENQKNDDECCICKSEGEEEELVVCDHCPRSFHPRCHLPHIENNVLRDDSQWMCTFCVFKTNQQCLYSDQPETDSDVMSRQISSKMLECQYLQLCLSSADEEQIFTINPVNYPKYSTFVKTPMWLKHISDKLQRRQYRTVGEFVSDVRLIFTNCATYNRDNAEFLAMGERLSRLFDEEFKKAFNIQH